MSARPSPQWWLTLALTLAAAASPLVAAWCVERIGDAAGRYEILSVGTLAALAVGGLAGLKRGGLWSLLSGPGVGFLVGLLDLRAFVWLYTLAECPAGIAAAAPVWGLLFGIWLALHRRRWWSRVLTVLAVAGIDLAARLCWYDWASVRNLQELGDWRWLAESLIYSPTAACIVLLMPRLNRGKLRADVQS